MSLFPSFFLASLLAFTAFRPAVAAPVTVTQLSGESTSGSISSLDGKRLLLENGTSIATEKIRTIAFGSAPSAGERKGTESLFLACGSLLQGSGALLTEEEKIVLQIGVSTPLALPIDAVRGIRFLPERKDSLFERNLAGKGDPNNDRVYVPQGAELRELSGLIESITETQITLDRNGSPVELSRGKVYGLLFATALEPNVEGFNARLRLTDGSMLRGKNAAVSGETFSMDIVQDVSVDLPLRSVANIRLQPPNLVYLSDLEPESAVAQPVLAPSREWQRDLNVLGGALQLGRQVFEKGVGMAAGTRLTYANPDQALIKFTAIAGIDSGRGKRGDCELVISGDGTELVRHRLKGGEDPVVINADIASSSSIVIHVEPGRDYDLSDHVNLCEAAFLKRK